MSIEEMISNRFICIKNVLDQFKKKLMNQLNSYEKIMIKNNKYFIDTGNIVKFETKRTSNVRLKQQNIGILYYKSLVIEFDCLPLGGRFTSKVFNVIIPSGAVKLKTRFEIKEIDSNILKFPKNMKLVSPVFELLPHSIKFNKEIKIMYKIHEKKISDKRYNICLFKQEIQDFKKGINAWSVYFTECEDSKVIQFELNSFSLTFIAICEYKLGINEFHEQFQDYEIIKPGLNYRINCTNEERCYGRLIIVHKGFGELFIPNSDALICPNCQTGININPKEMYKTIDINFFSMQVFN